MVEMKNVYKFWYIFLKSKYFLAPRPALHSLVKRYLDYSEPQPLRIAIGTYNINGGKHFR